MGFKPGIDGTVTGRQSGAAGLIQTSPLNLTAADSGKVYTLMADSDAQMVINLPTIVTGMDGTEYLFFIAETSTGGYQFNCGVDTDAFKGFLVMGTAAKDNEANGVVVAAGSNIDRISIKSGETNGAGGEGSMLRVTCLLDAVVPVWGVEGCVLTADVDSTGAALFSDTS